MEIREATERIVTEREKLYAAAYRAHGAQAMEALADAVKEAAPMYDKLSNKEQFVPLILKNLQADFSDAEQADIEVPAEFEKWIESALAEGMVLAKRKKQRMLLGAGAVVLSVGMLAVLCHVFRPEPPHVHTYDTELVAPTCQSTGYTRNYCACGDAYQSNFTEVGNHAWSDWKVITEPTFESMGEKRKTCTLCGEYQTQKLPRQAADHKHTYDGKVDVQKAASCTETGSERVYCSHDGCEAYIEAYVDTVSHSYGAWETLVQATQTEKGERLRKCTVCGLEQIEVLPSLNSTEIIMTGAKSYKNQNVTLMNMHNINDAIGFDGSHGGMYFNADNIAAVTAALDGSVYFLTISAVDATTRKDTVSLYKMRTSGWEKLCDFEVGFIASKTGGSSNWWKYVNKHFLMCDAQSRVYIFLNESGSLKAYRFDEATKQSVLLDSVTMIGEGACFDEDHAYFVAQKNSASTLQSVRFAFASGRFAASDSALTKLTSSREVLCKNDKVYVLGYQGNWASSATVLLYCFENFGTANEKVLYATEITPSTAASGENYAASTFIQYCFLAVDDTQTAYVFYSCRPFRENPKFVLSIVDSDGMITKQNEYDPLYPWSGSGLGGLFYANDGCLYFLEQSNSTPIAIGKLSGKNFETISEVAAFKDNDLETVCLTQEYYFGKTEKKWFFDMIYEIEVDTDGRNNYAELGYMRFVVE